MSGGAAIEVVFQTNQSCLGEGGGEGAMSQTPQDDRHSVASQTNDSIEDEVHRNLLYSQDAADCVNWDLYVRKMQVGSKMNVCPSKHQTETLVMVTGRNRADTQGEEEGRSPIQSSPAWCDQCPQLLANAFATSAELSRAMLC
eukprot:308312-Rhodomonas_salina.1